MTDWNKINHDWFELRVWGKTKWEGVPCQKCPLDLWIYQEIVHEVKPRLIIEFGTLKGGTTLFLARVLDAIGNGSIVSVDKVDTPGRPEHPRIEYVLGDSLDPGVAASVRYTKDVMRGPCLIIEDSEHSRRHVLAELNLYWSMVDVGSYFIVEDTNHHFLHTDAAPETPWDAVQEFVKGRNDVLVDGSREKYRITFNPGGYLKRIA